MGKKNKFKKSDEPADSKGPPQAQTPNKGSNKPGQQGSSEGQPKQGAWGGGQPKPQQNPQQAASSGQPRQQHNPPQGAWGGGQPKPQQNPQQGASGGGQPKQQQNPRQSALGREQQQQLPTDNKNQQRGGEQQRGGGDQRRGGGDQQRGGGDQRRGGGDQRRGGGDQQRHGGDQQRGGGNQQRGGIDQQRREAQQPSGGGWGQQQRNLSQQHGQHQRDSDSQTGRSQQRPSQSQHGSRQGESSQQGGAWSQQQRVARPDSQQRDFSQGAGHQQSGGQQQYGRGQQQRSQGGYSQEQQVRGRNEQHQQTRPSTSTENILPVKEKSCNGIVRGTLGSPGAVEVNYLRLDFDKMPDQAYHYDITITPDRPKKFLRPAFEQFRLEVFPNMLLTFDGLKNCYSLERLNTPVERTINVPDSGNRTKEFKVLIKETDTCVVDLKSLRTYQSERIFDKPMRALQVLEVVLASSNHERGIRVGRSFFRRPLDAFYLEDGYEAWTGLYQAAILGEMPLLNVDIAHKSFPCESTLIEYLDRMGIRDKNNDLSSSYSYRDINSFLRGVNVIYTPPASFGAPPKQYKVLEVGEPASKKTFRTDDGKQLTVAEYFRSRGCNLRYPNLNCLNVGSTVKQISLPMEFCSIPAGQALNRKDQSRQVEKMIRYAATSTNRRKQKIMELLTYFDHNINPIIRGFGLSIGSNFIKVPMRMLPSPALEYLQGQTVKTFKGAWRMDGKKFLICSKPPSGHKWAILYEEPKGGRGISYHDLENFRTAVAKTSQSLNMNLQNSAEILSYRYNQLQSMLRQLANDKYDLVFVVLNERGTPYSKIKQTAELEIGILTQCIKDKTIFRTARDYTVFSNILLKVNGKLNGTNHKVAQDRDTLLSPVKNVMYLGADVTHPSPDQREIPSVVGVAASHDQYGACYNCQYRLQRSTVENIEDMESIVTRHLEVYNKYQKRYPDQIIYYRDGVSDGQFPIVEREEIRAIKRACAKLRCNPKMTCVIVVKRHHTRFFPMKQPDNDRDFNNVQAGTVVDQYITHPNEVQFFMVSHQSIQGTARPTRYNVIMDESKFDINLLQKLTYNLCHLFPRCNRAVSYPAPAYLAHLVAFRGRVYLEGTQRFDSNLKREYDKRLIKPDFINKNPMYFI